MEEALIQVGLPVTCGWSDCGTKGNIKPRFVDPTHGGWYKSKMYRMRNKRWFCPEHFEQGREKDEYWQGKYATPEPEITEATQDELYKLLD